jgi:excisionase family DNA binding protein
MEGLVDIATVIDRRKDISDKRSWWYAAAESGRIPSYKIGKYRKFKLSEIDAWIAAQRQGPPPAA